MDKAMRYISKRAFVAEGIKKMVQGMWRTDQGPGQNLFRLISYAPSVFGWSGMMITALDKVLSNYGYGLEDFGRWLDEQGVTTQLFGMPATANLNDERINKIASSMENQIVKEAFASVVLKFIWKYVISPRALLKNLWRAAKYLLFAFGFTKIGEIYDMFTSGNEEGAREKGEEMAGAFQFLPKDPSLDPKNYGPQGYMGPRS